MNFVNTFSRPVSRMNISPDGDTSPDTLSQHHSRQSQIPRTLPSPVLYTTDHVEDRTIFDDENEHGWYDDHEPRSHSLYETDHLHQISWGITRKGHRCGSQETSESTKQPTASTSNHHPDDSVNFVTHSSHLQHINRQSASPNYGPSNKLTLFNSNTNNAVSNTEVATVNSTGNQALPDALPSLASSTCLLETPSHSSDDEAYHRAAQRRQLAIQKLMTYMKITLVTRMQFRSEVTRGDKAPYDYQSRCNATSSRTNKEALRSYPDTKQPLPPKKQRKLGSYPNGEEGEEEDDDDEEHAQGEIRKGKQKERLMFACPFAKYDRLRCSRKTCFNGGWPTVSRVKEHLYRNHKLLEEHCPRCQLKFEDAAAVSAHLREEPPCELSERLIREGFDLGQESKLRSREGLSKMNECEKWLKAYKILFPDVPEDQIPPPPPYYEDELRSLMEYIVGKLSSRLVLPLVDSLEASGWILPPLV